MPLPDPEVTPFGDSAALVQLDGPASAQALARELRRDPPPGVIACVPGLESLLVQFDPLVIDEASVRQLVAARLGSAAVAGELPGRIRTVPVVYGGDHGPDLDEVARVAGMTAQGVIDAHSTAELRVLFNGFAPGFTYLGDLPEGIRVPRLATPRTRTPRGSVAIAGAMSGIYPADLPGGWRVIGRTPLELFDPRRDPPAYLVPGDRVRFIAIAADEWEAAAREQGGW